MDGKMLPITHDRCRQCLIKTRQFQLRKCRAMSEECLAAEHALGVSGKPRLASAQGGPLCNAGGAAGVRCGFCPRGGYNEKLKNLCVKRNQIGHKNCVHTPALITYPDTYISTSQHPLSMYLYPLSLAIYIDMTSDSIPGRSGLAFSLC